MEFVPDPKFSLPRIPGRIFPRLENRYVPDSKWNQFQIEWNPFEIPFRICHRSSDPSGISLKFQVNFGPVLHFGC